MSKSEFPVRAYKEITTQEEMEAFLERVAGFHLSLARELHLTNRGLLNSDRSEPLAHRIDARLLVQSQRSPFAVELLFIGIQRLAARDSGEFWEASGSVEQEDEQGKPCISITFDGDFNITAKR